VFGGWDSDINNDTAYLQIFDLETETWEFYDESTNPNAPSIREGHKTVKLDERTMFLCKIRN
jgi:hypothetical protein